MSCWTPAHDGDRRDALRRRQSAGTRPDRAAAARTVIAACAVRTSRHAGQSSRWSGSARRRRRARLVASVKRLRSIGDHNLPVLLHGETGVGKDVFARAIHAASNRARRNYIALNCAAMPESLIDAELFGYEAGAFTGARRDGSKGLIVQADGGTLFLDEIGDMPLGPADAAVARAGEPRGLAARRAEARRR